VSAPAENGGVAGAARQVSERVSALARLELELAALEVKKKVAALGVGVAAGIGAALLGLLLAGFAFASVAAAFALFLPWWAALLAVTGILALLCAALALTAVVSLKKGAPPVPQDAIREAKLTAEAIRR